MTRAVALAALMACGTVAWAEAKILGRPTLPRDPLFEPAVPEPGARQARLRLRLIAHGKVAGDDTLRVESSGKELVNGSVIKLSQGATKKVFRTVKSVDANRTMLVDVTY